MQRWRGCLENEAGFWKDNKRFCNIQQSVLIETLKKNLNEYASCLFCVCDIAGKPAKIDNDELPEKLL